MSGLGSDEMMPAGVAFSRVDVLGAWALGDDEPRTKHLDESDDVSEPARLSFASTDVPAIEAGAEQAEPQALTGGSPSSGGAGALPTIVAEYTAQARQNLTTVAEVGRQNLATVAEVGMEIAAERIKERWELATEVVNILSQSEKTPTERNAAAACITDDEQGSRWDRVAEAAQVAQQAAEQARQSLVQAAERVKHGMAQAPDQIVTARVQAPPATEEQEREAEAPPTEAEQVAPKDGLHEEVVEASTPARPCTDGSVSDPTTEDEETSSYRWDRVQEAKLQAAGRVELVRQGVEQVRVQASSGLHQAAERWKLGATAIVQAAERVATQRGQETPTAEEATAVAQPENRPFWEVAVQDIDASSKSAAQKGQWLDTQVLSEGLGLLCRRSVLGSGMRSEKLGYDIRTS
mmetsp:Transcript_24524/g.56522  ORF Transcript_24524/g.56522 Transcript_24524/m.56522 type:complete len:407 (+) Transcript_24524:63-1283(+)